MVKTTTIIDIIALNYHIYKHRKHQLQRDYVSSCIRAKQKVFYFYQHTKNTQHKRYYNLTWKKPKSKSINMLNAPSNCWRCHLNHLNFQSYKQFTEKISNLSNNHFNLPTTTELMSLYRKTPNQQQPSCKRSFLQFFTEQHYFSTINSNFLHNFLQ